MPFKRHSFGLAFYLGSGCSVHHTFVCRILIMDAAIRGGLNVRIADAHGGAIHNVSVPVDSGDDAYEALSRAVENALRGVLYHYAIDSVYSSRRWWNPPRHRREEYTLSMA